jgi:hypothetical protein
MRVHAHAKLGPAGRLALVLWIEGGCSLRTAAAERAVAVGAPVVAGQVDMLLALAPVHRERLVS